MAHGGHHSTLGPDPRSDALHVRIIGEVPHGAKTADIEDPVEIFNLDVLKRHSLTDKLLLLLAIVELHANLIVLRSVDAAVVDRSDAALGGGPCHRNARLLE